jgi:CheY-like chemotaxis protein/AraC-like DNA-binding protein
MAESAHQAKLNFFTNISHEFKTPLTLILTPIDDLLEMPNIRANTRETVLLIQRNVLRLYKLVNQLMDFRKIELNKMLLKVSENDLVAFTKEITNTYEVLARKKHISLQFFTQENKIDVWFDPNMIDKVIFNLISNSFKFTKENGYIYVRVSRSNNYAVIVVEDNGVGMSADTIDHAFEPFFQGQYENYKGTGLGLALSKEFMELHHGTIQVTSEKWRGTTFEVRLPLGKSHFDTREIEQHPALNRAIEEDAKMYTTAISSVFEPENTEENNHADSNRHCVLIIEDNQDLKSYLKLKLGNEFDILECNNGNSAIELAFENAPDLILSDIVLPGKNGIELTQIFKTDTRTAHIPIILLTARSSELQKIEGLKSEADAYITKPFNLTELKQTINNLIANRNKVKGHYSSEIFSEEKSLASKKTDRKFISEFSLIIENNFSNEKFGVDDICKEMGISRIQLYRKVKKILGVSVNDYLVTTRLQKAKYFMQHEDYSISEIAYKTGFSSAAYFSTVFKSKFNITPRAFKENK